MQGRSKFSLRFFGAAPELGDKGVGGGGVIGERRIGRKGQCPTRWAQNAAPGESGRSTARAHRRDNPTADRLSTAPSTSAFADQPDATRDRAARV